LKANLDFSNASVLNLATEKDTALRMSHFLEQHKHFQLYKDVGMIWGLKMRLYNDCKTYLLNSHSISNQYLQH